MRIRLDSIKPRDLRDAEIEILHGLLQVCIENPDFSPWEDWTEEAIEGVHELYRRIEAFRQRRETWQHEVGVCK